MMQFDNPVTVRMQKFVAKEGHRITGLAIRRDKTVILTDPAKWRNGATGNGEFVGRHANGIDSEYSAIFDFYQNVRMVENGKTG